MASLNFPPKVHRHSYLPLPSSPSTLWVYSISFHPHRKKGPAFAIGGTYQGLGSGCGVRQFNSSPPLLFRVSIQASVLLPARGQHICAHQKPPGLVYQHTMYQTRVACRQQALGISPSTAALAQEESVEGSTHVCTAYPAGPSMALAIYFVTCILVSSQDGSTVDMDTA